MSAEITWSLMHPTSEDVNYMSRVIREAARYDMDSFEICGAFASPTGGINGLALLEPYPTAYALRDKETILKHREIMTQIISLAHSIGKPIYIWHREIMMPKGVIDDAPDMIDDRGEFDLLGKSFQDFLRYKLANAFDVLPELDGVVLTLTEADYSVIHNSNPDRYPPDRVVEEIVSIFAEEHRKRGKRFILRSFGSIARDYEDILRGAKKAAEKYHFDIETKITPYDFSPFLPPNPFLVRQENTELNAECDCLGEFLGAGYLPSANLDNIARYVKEGKAAGVSRYAIRLDRIGNNIFDCHEVNLYAYHQLIRNDNATADSVYSQYAAENWQDCQQEMISLARMGLEAVKKCNFISGNVTFHKFPILPEMKWVSAGGILGVFKDNVPLKQLCGCWGILADRNSPGRENIKREKDEAVALAEKGLEIIHSLQGRLSEKEYRKTERVWRILLVASKAIRAFVRSVAAYFDDMESGAETPDQLLAAIKDAENIITPMLTDKSDALPTLASCCDGAALPGDDLDRVYLKGLLFLSRELVIHYQGEYKLRQEFAARSQDIVLAGTIGDQYRIFRYMHASHTDICDGIPVRYAGNTVFPNGFIAVDLNTCNDAAVEIKVLPGSAEKISISLNGETAEYNINPDGTVLIPAMKSPVTEVKIEKCGVTYPAIIYIRSFVK